MDNLYANVPRDLTRVKSKLFLNLTKRQILCFGAAILVGLPLFFLLKKTGNMTLASMVMILVMLPFFFFAMYEKNGQPLEVILKHFVTARFKRTKIRKYRTENTFRRALRYRPVDNSRHAREKKQKKNDNTQNKAISGPAGSDKSNANADVPVIVPKKKMPSGGKEVPHVREA